MKKLLIIATVALGMTANAQEETKTSNSRLPQQGDWSISFDASDVFRYAGNLLNDNTDNAAPSFDNEIGSLFVGKVMDTDMTATRYIAGFMTNFSSTTQPSTQTMDSKTSNSIFVLTAGYGKEWRKGTKRFQGYYGADALVKLSKVGGKSTEDNFDVDTKGDRKDATTSSVTKSKGGLGFGIGARGFAGVEYFILPKIALGVEYNYTAMFEYAGNPHGETEITFHKNAPATAAHVPAEQKNGGESGLKLSNVGTANVRVAFYF